jgi:hypothetical protein
MTLGGINTGYVIDVSGTRGHVRRHSTSVMVAFVSAFDRHSTFRSLGRLEEEVFQNA